MARYSSRGRRSSFRSRNRTGRSRYSVRRTRRSYSRAPRRRASGGRTIRIVLEQPGASAVSRPGVPGLIGVAQSPRGKAQF